MWCLLYYYINSVYYHVPYSSSFLLVFICPVEQNPRKFKLTEVDLVVNGKTISKCTFGENGKTDRIMVIGFVMTSTLSDMPECFRGISCLFLQGEKFSGLMFPTPTAIRSYTSGSLTACTVSSFGRFNNPLPPNDVYIYVLPHS